MESFKSFLKPYYHKIINLLKFSNRIGLRNKNISIISNNCAGGFLSQHFGLPYNSPTAELFLAGNDYLRFTSHIEHYLSLPLMFIDPQKSKHYALVKNTNLYGEYPVALCDDIEIFFMHYHSQAEAQEKWGRRSKKINPNNCIYLLFESDLTTKQDILEFAKKDSRYLVFSYNKYADKNILYSPQVGQDPEHSWKPEIVVTLKDWKILLNSMKQERIL